MPPLSPFSKSCTALAVSQLLLINTSSHAATITVNSNSDNGSGCTLREAIASANNTSNQNNGCGLGSNGTDTITFSNSLPTNTVTLSNGELYIGSGKDIVIDASNLSGGMSVNANRLSRVLNIESASVTLQNLNLRDGLVSGNPDDGGGIHVTDASLTLRNSNVINNTAFLQGGGILASNSTLNIYDSAVDNNVTTGGEYSGALGGGISIVNSTLTVANSTISDNASFYAGGLSINNTTVMINDSVMSGNNASLTSYGSYGGAIFVHNTSDLTLNRSTLTGNSAYYGGAIEVSYNIGTVLINNSTISNNSAIEDGGGINIVSSGNLIINNSTLSGNSAGVEGGAIDAYSRRSPNNYAVFINNSTLSDNSASREVGISTSGRSDRMVITNSVIANSLGGADCDNSPSSSGNNFTIDAASIIEDGSCGANRSGDPGLLPLADNGGVTQTHSLATDSIAINSGDQSTCLATDQRGLSRDSQCDVGAFEFGVDAANETSTFVIPLPNGKTVIFDL